MSIYPFTLHPSEYREGRVDSPRLARAIWTRVRKEDPELTKRTWYAVGVEVDKDALDLRIYRMRDSIYGGLGSYEFSLGSYEFSVSVKRSDLTQEEQAILLEVEQQEALQLAEQEIERLDNEAYQQRRKALAAQLFPAFFTTKEQ